MPRFSTATRSLLQCEVSQAGQKFGASVRSEGPTSRRRGNVCRSGRPVSPFPAPTCKTKTRPSCSGRGRRSGAWSGAGRSIGVRPLGDKWAEIAEHVSGNRQTDAGQRETRADRLMPGRKGFSAVTVSESIDGTVSRRRGRVGTRRCEGFVGGVDGCVPGAASGAVSM